MLSDNLAPIISPHPGKVLPGAVLPVYPMLESLRQKSDGIEHGSVWRVNYTVLEPLRARGSPDLLVTPIVPGTPDAPPPVTSTSHRASPGRDAVRA